MPLRPRLVALLEAAASGDPQAARDFYRLRSTFLLASAQEHEVGRRAALRMIRPRSSN